MKLFHHIIQDDCGIHARPAVQLTQAARQFKSKIEILVGEELADLDDVLQLMGLQIVKGDEIKVVIDGEDEEEACLFMQNFFRGNI